MSCSPSRIASTTESKSGDVFSGTARFTSGPYAGRTWNFRVEYRGPVAVQAPAPQPVAAVQGRVFSGQEVLNGYGSLTFRFLDATTVEMVDTAGATRGTYVLTGNQVVLTIGAVVYRGEIRGNEIVGSGNNPSRNLSWQFRVVANG